MRRRVACSLIIAVVAACGGDDVPDRTLPDTAAPAPALPPTDPATVTLDQFRGLHWLAGRWQGFMVDGSRFYEQYRVENDSTIVMTSYPDSTFAAPGDESRIALRNGTVSSESAASRYVATRVDSAGADFAPRRGANNAFTWLRQSNDRWTATLRWTDRDGRPQTVVYALHRLGR